MDFIYHHRTGGRGAEGLHIMSIVRALERQGHHVCVVSPPGVDPRKTAGEVPLDKGARQQKGIGRIWQWLSCKSPQWMFEVAELAYNFYALVRLIPILRRHSTKTAVFYERHALFLWAGIAVAKWFGLPVVLEVNEVSSIKRARKQTLVGLALWIERHVFPKADLIVTVSSFLREEVLKRGARPETVLVLPNAIDPARFSLGSGIAVRQELGLIDQKVIGFAGWFDQWDRLNLFVGLASRLIGPYPKLHILLVGDGPGRVDLEREIQGSHLEKVFTLTGPVPRHDVARYIDAMDICVLPDSNPFGSPMVLFEFMALAKAVVAPDLPPIRDVITDWKNGLIATPGCLDSLEKAVRVLLDNPDLSGRLGAEARRTVLQKHTWDANAGRIVGLLQNKHQPDITGVRR